MLLKVENHWKVMENNRKLSEKNGISKDLKDGKKQPGTHVLSRAQSVQRL